MNIEEVRDYTLMLCNVTEDQVFGPDIVNFRIEGKIFLCLWLGEYGPNMPHADEPRFALKLSPKRNEELRASYSGVRPAYHWNKKHWSDIYFDSGIEDKCIKAWIKESYEFVISLLPNSIRKKYNH